MAIVFLAIGVVIGWFLGLTAERKGWENQAKFSTARFSDGRFYWVLYDSDYFKLRYKKAVDKQ